MLHESKMGELKIAAIFGAMLFLLLGPCGVYLMSFHGVAGEVLAYLGMFVLLPAGALYRHYGLSSWVFWVFGMLGQYLWFMLWVALARWYHLRKLKTVRPTGQ